MSPSSTTSLAQATRTDLRSDQKKQPKMSSPLRQEKRSFSWPGSLPPSERSKLTSSFRPHLPVPWPVIGKTSLPSSSTTSEEVKSYNMGQIRPKILTTDKTPLWVSATSTTHSSAHVRSSEPVLGLSIINPPHTSHAPSPVSAASVTIPSPGQSPFGASLIYQVTPAAAAAASPQGGFGVRQPMFAPVLTVLPTGLMAHQSAAGMPPCQPILLSSPQKISAPLLGQAVPAQQTARSEALEPKETVALASPEPAIFRRIAEPTTGQSMMPLVISSETTSTIVPGRTSPSRTLASIPFSEMTPAYIELKAFAEDFKTKRIRLGFTQGAVGQSLADKGYSNFAQSTISRFEQMQLSPTNAAAIKQVLEKWLQEAESPTSAHSSTSTSASSMTTRKRKKRVVFTPQTRASLEHFFKQNPRPNRQLIEAVAEQLELMPEEVRVWFCNKRQKQKQSQSMQAYPTSTHDREATLSTASSGTNSPTSFYEASHSKRSTPSPKTGFSIEELSKSSTSSSVNTSPVQLSSFMMSSSLPTGAQRGFPLLLTSSPSAAGLINMSGFVTTTAAQS